MHNLTHKQISTTLLQSSCQKSDKLLIFWILSASMEFYLKKGKLFIWYFVVFNWDWCGNVIQNDLLYVPVNVSPYFFILQNETRVLRVKVIAGMDLAKKDILGARWILFFFLNRSEISWFWHATILFNMDVCCTDRLGKASFSAYTFIRLSY